MNCNTTHYRANSSSVPGDPTLTNASGAAINALQGAGGGRTLNAALDNQGTLTVSGSQGLTFNRASSVHTNSGTIDVQAGDLTVNQSGTAPGFTNSGTLAIAAGRTFKVSGGTFTQSSGTLSGAGTLSLYSLTASFATPFTNATTALSIEYSTVNGSGTLTNAAGRTLILLNSAVNAPLVNDGTLIGRLTSTIGSGAGSFTTAGTSIVRVEGHNLYGGANLIVTNGFTNNGAIEITDTGYAYGATLTVTNNTLVNATGATISTLQGAGGPRALNAALDNRGTLTTIGSQELTFNRASSAHANSGTLDLQGGNLSIHQSGTSPSFTNTGTLTIGAGRTLLFNQGTINWNGGSVGGTGALDLTGVTMNGSGTFTNPAGRTVVLLSSTINAALLNQGTLVARLTSGIGSASGSFTTAAGSVLRVEGHNNHGGATLTVTNGFTNNGTIEITDTGYAYGATLTVTNGTLVNPSGSKIDVLQGAGGPRALNAEIDNKGTLIMSSSAGLSMSRASSAHANSGTIDVQAGNLTVNQSGASPSFTNTGTLTVATSRTLTVSGGAFTHNGGTLAGSGTVNLSALTATLSSSLTNATTALSLTTNTTMNGPGTLTNAAGRTFTLNNSTINAPLVNNGTLVANLTSTIGSASFTTAVGSILRVEGHNLYGGGNLTVSNGFANRGTLELTDTGYGYGATLTVSNGSLTNVSGATLTSLTGAGGPRTLVADVINDGTLALSPGAAGTLTLTGSLTNRGGGTLSADLGGLTAGSQHDRLNVSGAVSFGGTLDVALFGGFTPTAGNTFTILTQGSGGGTFATINSPAGHPLTPTYNPTSFVLTR